MDKKVYYVEDILQAEYNLEPLACKYCGSTEVTFNSLVADAYCAECGHWQLDPCDGCEYFVGDGSEDCEVCTRAVCDFRDKAKGVK